MYSEAFSPGALVQPRRAFPIGRASLSPERCRKFSSLQRHMLFFVQFIRRTDRQHQGRGQGDRVLSNDDRARGWLFPVTDAASAAAQERTATETARERRRMLRLWLPDERQTTIAQRFVFRRRWPRRKGRVTLDVGQKVALRRGRVVLRSRNVRRGLLSQQLTIILIRTQNEMKSAAKSSRYSVWRPKNRPSNKRENADKKKKLRNVMLNIKIVRNIKTNA